MKRNELITSLFIQAWWNDIVGDAKESSEIMLSVIQCVYTGFPFPTKQMELS